MGLALALCPVSVGGGAGRKKKLHIQGDQTSAKPKAIFPGNLGGSSDSIVFPELLIFSSFPSVDPVLPLSWNDILESCFASLAPLPSSVPGFVEGCGSVFAVTISVGLFSPSL